MSIKLDTTYWMLPYGTLMMIVMIFFVILYSFSQMKSKIEYEKTIAGLQSAVSGEKNQALKEAEMAGMIEDVFKQANMSSYAAVTIDAEIIKIALTHNIIFDSGSIVLKEEAKKALSKLAEAIKGLPNSIVVEGHTDNVPVSGSRIRSNWDLSAMRAFSVIKYMMDEEGIDPERLAAYGYGEFKPVASNDTEAGREENRRIEISIIRER